jgi:hypothetical protein
MYIPGQQPNKMPKLLNVLGPLHKIPNYKENQSAGTG